MESMTTARRYDERRVKAAYRALIATPGVGTVVLPLAADFAVKSLAGNIAGATALTVTGYHSRAIKVPLMEAGKFKRVDRLERAASVVISAGFELYVDAGLGKLSKIGGA